jgi:hypothetical protein
MASFGGFSGIMGWEVGVKEAGSYIKVNRDGEKAGMRRS